MKKRVLCAYPQKAKLLLFTKVYFRCKQQKQQTSQNQQQQQRRQQQQKRKK